ncbi:hypothetical protein SAICODRAFT_99191 [Saitoella complicata NRRL Y-17804]|uniref:Uncharacterized protein n=1 Tax=Saitoella complicata (strain BCRC 22490 / CBS 7301 / JCM 7358 / NBRC 10748 / NRRL Y-17804) TaxID=698492 RepID=A0A0E9NNW3_SAICN|nr:uncharacterized protein SAICODRAFT_99191 [Saitoella complicata NRRL Y-17804]ODQ55972.1 hypothetical protein SAICODRAFT_99191 [Saitoella complicata NRRL Y-17804]GAO51524.1 hypothetical protein G7K_5623-t1 [Saitoella complicata NRRL Y-17804]
MRPHPSKRLKLDLGSSGIAVDLRDELDRLRSQVRSLQRLNESLQLQLKIGDDVNSRMGRHNVELEEDNERLRRGLVKDTPVAKRNGEALAEEVTRLRRELGVMAEQRYAAQSEVEELRDQANLADQLREENERLKRDMAAADEQKTCAQTDAKELRRQAELLDPVKKANERLQREMVLAKEHMKTVQTELEDLRPKAALVDRLSDSNDKMTEAMKEQTQKLKAQTFVATHLTEENKRLQREMVVALEKMKSAQSELVQFQIYNNNLAGQLQQCSANMLDSERARSALLITASQAQGVKGNQLVADLQKMLATVHQTNQKLLQKLQEQGKESNATIDAQKLEIARLQKTLMDAAPMPQANDQVSAVAPLQVTADPSLIEMQKTLVSSLEANRGLHQQVAGLEAELSHWKSKSREDDVQVAEFSKNNILLEVEVQKLKEKLKKAEADKEDTVKSINAYFTAIIRKKRKAEATVKVQQTELATLKGAGARLKEEVTTLKKQLEQAGSDKKNHAAPSQDLKEVKGQSFTNELVHRIQDATKQVDKLKSDLHVQVTRFRKELDQAEKEKEQLRVKGEAKAEVQRIMIEKLQKNSVSPSTVMAVNVERASLKMKLDQAERDKMSAETSLRKCRSEAQQQKLEYQSLIAESLRMQARAVSSERRHNKQMNTLGGTNTNLAHRMGHLMALVNQREQHLLALQRELQESRRSSQPQMPGTVLWTAPAPRGPISPQIKSPEQLESDSLRTQITTLESLCGEQQAQIEVLLGENEDFKMQIPLLRARMDNIEGGFCERCTEFETQVKELKEESAEEQGRVVNFEEETDLLEGQWDSGDLADAGG